MSIEILYSREHGDWLGFHTGCPRMTVSGNTEEIVREVIRKNLVWYHERQVKKREREVLSALSEVIKMEPKAMDIVDTAPSEITVYEEFPYMHREDN